MEAKHTLPKISQDDNFDYETDNIVIELEKEFSEIDNFNKVVMHLKESIFGKLDKEKLKLDKDKSKQ